VNREQWLTALKDRLDTELFTPRGQTLPANVRISVGFPSRGGTSTRNPTIGQCFYSDASDDQVFEIFISPVLGEGLIAGATLVHELCHALLPKGVGHKRAFQRLAHKMGLEGKATATIAGVELTTRLEELIAAIGPYPHAELHPLIKTRKQSTRMHKVACGTCGYTVRISKAWIEKGLPACPVEDCDNQGLAMDQEEKDDEGAEEEAA
jgi:hypothetical protein